MALPWEVCAATAFFNVPGFNLLADELKQTAHVRLLLGAERTPEAVAPLRQPGDPTEPAFTRRQVAAALRNPGAGLVQARDLLPFDEATDAALRRRLTMLYPARAGERSPDEYRCEAVLVENMLLPALVRNYIGSCSDRDGRVSYALTPTGWAWLDAGNEPPADDLDGDPDRDAAAFYYDRVRADLDWLDTADPPARRNSATSRCPWRLRA